MAHVEEATTSFADDSKGGHDGRLDSLAHGFAEGRFRGVQVLQFRLNGLFQRLKARLEVVIAERLHFGFVRVDGGDARLQLFYVALVLGADEAGDDPVENLCWIHEWLRLLVIFERAGARTGRTRYRRNSLFYLFRCASAKRGAGTLV